MSPLGKFLVCATFGLSCLAMANCAMAHTPVPVAPRPATVRTGD